MRTIRTTLFGIAALSLVVLTGWGEGSLGEYRHLWAHTQANHIANDATQAVSWVLAQLEASRRTSAAAATRPRITDGGAFLKSLIRTITSRG